MPRLLSLVLRPVRAAAGRAPELAVRVHHGADAALSGAGVRAGAPVPADPAPGTSPRDLLLALRLADTATVASFGRGGVAVGTRRLLHRTSVAGFLSALRVYRMRSLLRRRAR